MSKDSWIKEVGLIDLLYSVAALTFPEISYFSACNMDFSSGTYEWRLTVIVTRSGRAVRSRIWLRNGSGLPLG